MSARGIGHLVGTEKAVPGVEQVKSLVGTLTGLTAEKDAIFQVGIDLSIIVAMSAGWLMRHRLLEVAYE